MSRYFPILNDGVSSLEPGVSGTKAQTIIVFLRRRIKKQFSKTVTFYFISGSSNARRPGIVTRAGFPECKLQPSRGAPGSRGIFENRGASLHPLSFKTSADQHLGSHLQASESTEIRGGRALVKRSSSSVHEPMNILYRW